MKDLKEILVQFKQATLELIRSVKQDEINKLDALLDKRQMLIEDMEKLTYTTEEFTDICNEMNILSAQQELSELMKEKKESIKLELSKIQLTKNANNNYNKSFYNNIEMFNKKI